MDKEKEKLNSLISNFYPIFEDESNEEVQYTRNRIRKEILPLLDKENIDHHKLYWNFHEWDKDQTNFSEHFQENQTAKKEIHSPLSIPHQTWIQLNKQFQKQILDVYLKQMGFYPMDRSRFEELQKQAEGQKTFVETNQYIIYKSKSGDMNLYPKTSLLLQSPSFERNGHKFKIQWNSKFKEYEDPNQKLSLGTAKTGEKIKIKTGNKEISECLREKKIPFFIRQNLPILYYENEPLQILFSLYSEEEKDYPALDSNLFL